MIKIVYITNAHINNSKIFFIIVVKEYLNNAGIAKTF